ncbi:MAG: type II secretion system protein GspF, partial [Myxococcota bacterium]
MAVYEFTGISVAGGKPIKGLRDAENEKALRTQLRRDGILLTKATEGAEAAAQKRGELSLKRFLNKPNTGDIAIMTRQLAT